MAITVGFKRATIYPFGNDSNVVAEDKIVIEGKQDEGGMVEATISGISAEASKVFASNVAYFVSQKGVGDLQCEFSILDFPVNAQAILFGWKENETTGVIEIGESTQPPYAAAVLESAKADGTPIAFALYKGRFSQDEVKLATATDEAFEPEAETTTMNCIANNDGNSIGIAVGAEQVAELKKIAFPGLPSA